MQKIEKTGGGTSFLRKQTGAFGDGFAKLDQYKYKDNICKWRKALEEAGGLTGWPNKDDVYETKFIDDIVDELFAGVVPSCMLDVADHPVELESCSKAVNELLDLEKNVVGMIGIWGVGGIGKTTIAKAVSNSILHMFDGSCFLVDVRSNLNGRAQLQETLLSHILGDSNLKISSVGEGLGLIKTRMQRKKVLIILDDVSDYSSQLKKLVPSHNCFGWGTRILITTRDKRWLIAHEVDEVYKVKMLDDCQAMKLFSLNAFKTIGPPSDHLELAERAIRYAQGLPLALILLGSHLFLRSRDEWEATLSSCSGDPHTKIRDILKLSYDALGPNLKEVFLDIACFFKGKYLDDVKPRLQACYGLNSGIEQLQEKALLRIDDDDEDERWIGERWRGHRMDRIWMHDLIEEMGKKIANPEGEHDKSTRLWKYDDVERALTYRTGTNKIKGIHLEFQYNEKEICLNDKSFSEMNHLRYFSCGMDCIKWSGNISRLPDKMRWLEWPGCPLQRFPSDFYLPKLNKLNICYTSHITRLWNRRKNLPNLKSMDLTGCESLKELPDFSGIPNLIELRVSYCESLAEIHHSIGSLEKLEILDLQDCTGLQEFPKFIGKLDSLRELNVSWTSAKWSIDDEKQLWLECCQNITTLSRNSLRNLEILKLSGRRELVTFPRKARISPDDDSGSLLLPMLREFNIHYCNLSTADFIGDLDCLETLNNLCLSWNHFITLPALDKFVNLSRIDLSYCKRLREIPELPPNILEIHASGCESLEKFLMWPKSLNTVQMKLEDCDRFSECLGNDMKMMENIFLNNQESRFSLVFPSLGCEVPKWFQYYSKEVIATEKYWSRSTCAISFEIPSKLKLENIEGVAICSDFRGVPKNLHADLSINGVHIHQYIYECELTFSVSDHMWVGSIPLSGEIKGKLLGQWPYKCRVEFECREMKSCGVHLVCQPPNENSNKMVMEAKPAGESGMHTKPKRPHTRGNDDYYHQQEQQEQPLTMIPSKRHCTEDELSRDPIDGLDLQLTLVTPRFQ